MAEPYGGDKTLPASPRKLEEAREKGNVARSQDLSAAITILVALFALSAVGPELINRLRAVSEYFLGEMHYVSMDESDMQQLVIQILGMIAPTVMVFMLILLAGGIAINVAQFGILFTVRPLLPQFERINPVTGFQKFFSARALVELAKSLMKITFIGSIVWWTYRDRLDDVLSLMHAGPAEMSVAVWSMLVAVWWRIVLAMLIIGVLDYAFQYWQRHRDLMMTVQEAKEELKRLEGDPRIKQRVRGIQRQMARQRMFAAVPEADVVITNPTTYAVAVRYDAGSMNAPKVTAKGARILADRIRALAVENDVPIVQRPELARTLYRTVEIGQFVREDLFRAVAEVLAYVYRIDRRVARVRERDSALPLAG
ncbi:MAG: flagellar biosynthesis protein FlhB [Candidatus Hydrogenedentota bacterium]